ncbi:MAG: hypothetical protein AB1Z19_06755, partial [Eubacteriales bacterium]
IHGEDELARLCEQNDTTGFVLPSLQKESFIDALLKYGVLPKKCFSLGEANEKRYYLESRLLDEVMEVDENHEMFVASELEETLATPVKKEKESWLDQGNNEDIISLAFANPDEDDEPELGTNEFLDAEPPEPRPEDYLSRKELKLLKKQQRIEKMIGEVTGSAEEILSTVDEDVVEEVGELALTRREKRLLKRQQEYEKLLGEIDGVQKENTKADSAAEKGKEETRMLTWRDKRVAEETQKMLQTKAKEPEPEESQAEAEAPQDRPLSKREQRALKRQQEYEALLAEIENERSDEKQAMAEEPEQDVEPTETPVLSKRELRAQKRREKYEALMAEVGLEADEQETEDKPKPKSSAANTKEKPATQEPVSEETVEQTQEAQPLTRKEMRIQKRLERTEAMIAAAGMDFEGSEEAEAKAESSDETESLKSKALPKEIAEALEGVTEDDSVDISVYALEKARIRLEEERIKLERYKVREETRLKLQLEREKQKAIKRMEREAQKRAEQEELADLLKERTGSDAVDADDAEGAFSNQQRKGIAGALDEVVSEVKKNEAEKLPERVIIRKGTSEIIGHRKQVDMPEGKPKAKRRRGTLVVKRASDSDSRYTSNEE